MIRIRRKPSPALIVAILALIVAMAGGAYAATVAKNSVGSKQLKKNAVKSGKIVNGAVTSDKIANKAVTSGKFFLSVVANLNFPIISASDCGTLPVSPKCRRTAPTLIRARTPLQIKRRVAFWAPSAGHQFGHQSERK